MFSLVNDIVIFDCFVNCFVVFYVISIGYGGMISINGEEFLFNVWF